MNDVKSDCFISSVLYILDIWDKEYLTKSILSLTYDFYYNANWKTLDDTIIYCYLKDDILEALCSCGIYCCKKNMSALELSSNSFNINEMCMLIIDGYECSWHQAYQKYHVDHYLVLKKMERHKIIVVDPFYEGKEFELDNKFGLKQVIFRNMHKEQKNTHIKKELNKDKYLNDLNLFCDDLLFISDQLLNYNSKFETIQFLRDIKSIVYSKYNLMKVFGNKSEITVQCKGLINQWEVLLSRLIYIALTKKIQKENLKEIGKNIKQQEKELLQYL